jgi:lysophospholipase L1-like esterase
MDNMLKQSRYRYAAYLVVIGVFLPLIILVAIEGGARLYIYYMYSVPGKVYGLWRYDEVLGAQHRENAYNSNAQTNNWGFRGKENVLELKPPGAWRIITYGGSTTFCYNLADDETWPVQLEHQLRAGHHPMDQVLNGGAIMWSLGHAYARAQEDVPTLKPDYVVLYSGINEQANSGALKAAGTPLDMFVGHGRYGVFAKNLDQNRWAKRNLALVRVLDYVITPALSKWKGEPGVPYPTQEVVSKYEPDPVVLDNYLHVLREFIGLVRENGGQVIFLIQAHSRQVTRNEYLTSYSRAGARAAETTGAIVVDSQRMVDSFPGSPSELFSESGVHYSEKGARLLAEYVYGSVFAEGAAIGDGVGMRPTGIATPVQGGI